MKIAIMQPYFFPYIGYFQLISAVDKFVVFDDVNYINRGWINRNNILIARKSCLISLPLKEASQNKKIYEIEVSYEMKVVDKLLKTISLNYRRAPYFEIVYDLLLRIFSDTQKNISEFNLYQLKSICSYLGLNRTIIDSSKIYNNTQLKGEDRIIDICMKESANVYINPIGGIELYDRNVFEKHNIQLFFLKSSMVEYNQFVGPFVPWLSIIDVLMFNSKERVSMFLENYELI